MHFNLIDSSLRSAAFTAVLIAAGCVAHLPPGGVTMVASSPSPSGVVPSPTSSSSPASGPTPCSATATAAPNVQLVDIALDIAPTSAQPYGTIAGYGLVQGSSVAANASPIALLPTDRVQFINGDIVRALSAAGLAASAISGSGAFPATYSFAATAANASGAQIDGQGSWSTGLLGSNCYSQVFTFSRTGTFYFGDVNSYAVQNVRNVFVVSTGAPQ